MRGQDGLRSDSESQLGSWREDTETAGVHWVFEMDLELAASSSTQSWENCQLNTECGVLCQI